MEACLKEKVIMVPGLFFDLNPSKRRDLFDSPCHHYVRLSYGPRMEVLKMGLDAVGRVVAKYGGGNGGPVRQEGPEEVAVEGHGAHVGGGHSA